MKKVLLSILFLISSQTFACGINDYHYILDGGLGESLANDCLDDGIGLKKLSESLKHFVSMVEEYETYGCATPFPSEMKHELVNKAIEMAKTCVEEN